MKECISREAALAALKTYNKEPFHILHGLTVEGVMRWYANELGYGEDADFWATVGLLHDIDFEDKKFAAGCSRDVINTGAERLGWTIEELMEKTILAMRSCEESVNKEMETLA